MEKEGGSDESSSPSGSQEWKDKQSDPLSMLRMWAF